MIMNKMVNVYGHQLLATTGHPLHHLLVGHQGQLGPSQVHVPPGDGGDDDDIGDDRDNHVPPLGENDENAYLIFVMGATGGARVNFFGQCNFLQI